LTVGRRGHFQRKSGLFVGRVPDLISAQKTREKFNWSLAAQIRIKLEVFQDVQEANLFFALR
jgi:hypothetical protein